MSAPGFAAPVAPQPLGAAEAEKATKEILRDREDTKKWLKSSPTSYLATVARGDFGAKTAMTVGSADDNDVRLKAAGIRPHHLKVMVAGDKFRVEAEDPQAHFTVNKDTTPVIEVVLEPGSVGVGRFVLRLSHQGFPAIIVFDPKSPRFKEYKGIEYFPIDFSYRYAATLTPNPKPETVVIMSTRGNRRRALRVGWFEFLVGKTPCKLEANRLLEPGIKEDDLSVFFRDATTGRESYPVGRYVEPKRQADGTYILDFNMAYNPACAFSDHYNCPIPPKENALPLAIRAGEMDSRYH